VPVQLIFIISVLKGHIMIQSAQKRLSEAEITQFHQEGYLMVEDIFTEADFAPVMAELTENIDRLARQAVEAGSLSRDYAEEDFEHRLAKISAEDPSIPSQLWNGVAMGSFFDLIRTPRLLDIVEQFCGPEIIASSVYRLRPKVPSHKQSPVPWHQDSGYFEPYCDKSLVLTVWLPLVDATVDNGCLWVKPRGHLQGNVVGHHQRADQPYLEIPAEELARCGEAEPVPVEVPKFGALFLTNLTPHASFENNTDRVRWSMDLRYQSADLPTNADITRLPGERVGDESGDVPIACYPPEPDFLVRSKKRPDELCPDAETFLKLRREHVARPVTNRFNGYWEGLDAAGRNS